MMHIIKVVPKKGKSNVDKFYAKRENAIHVLTENRLLAKPFPTKKVAVAEGDRLAKLDTFKDMHLVVEPYFN